MSGIYIPGMEMPKEKGPHKIVIRLFVREDGTAGLWGLEEYIPHEPLDVIPVPDHGRLIDADEAVRLLCTILDPIASAKACGVLAGMKTIIKAEGGEQMDNTINTSGSTCTYKPYENNCIHRLPCGLCTYMHILCPLVNKMDITWTVTTGTTREVQNG